MTQIPSNYNDTANAINTKKKKKFELTETQLDNIKEINRLGKEFSELMHQIREEKDVEKRSILEAKKQAKVDKIYRIFLGDILRLTDGNINVDKKVYFPSVGRTFIFDAIVDCLSITLGLWRTQEGKISTEVYNHKYTKEGHTYERESEYYGYLIGRYALKSRDKKYFSGEHSPNPNRKRKGEESSDEPKTFSVVSWDALRERGQAVDKTCDIERDPQDWDYYEKEPNNNVNPDHDLEAGAEAAEAADEADEAERNEDSQAELNIIGDRELFYLMDAMDRGRIPALARINYELSRAFLSGSEELKNAYNNFQVFPIIYTFWVLYDVENKKQEFENALKEFPNERDTLPELYQDEIEIYLENDSLFMKSIQKGCVVFIKGETEDYYVGMKIIIDKERKEEFTVQAIRQQATLGKYLESIQWNGDKSKMSRVHKEFVRFLQEMFGRK